MNESQLELNSSQKWDALLKTIHADNQIIHADNQIIQANNQIIQRCNWILKIEKVGNFAKSASKKIEGRNKIWPANTNRRHLAFAFCVLTQRGRQEKHETTWMHQNLKCLQWEIHDNYEQLASLVYEKVAFYSVRFNWVYV